MAKTLDTKHWYDGLLYAIFYDPVEKEKRELISGFIEDNSTVIDIGCGTGALAFQLAKRCKRVIGVELSSKMFRFASKKKEEDNVSNVEFIQADATKLSEIIDQQFDYATLSLAFHEMFQDERVKILKEMKAVAKSVIISDYIAPLPKNHWGIIINFMELFFGGIPNFITFRSYISDRGIDGLLDVCGFGIEQEKLDWTKAYKVVKVSA